MKVLVFSDSHGATSKIKKAIALHPDYEKIIFLGDGILDINKALEGNNDGKEVIIVKGNCDSFALGYKDYFEGKMEDYNIIAFHGHNQKVKYHDDVIREYARRGYDIILHGHTHRYREDRLEGSYVLNPGSIKEGSFGVLYLEKTGILFSWGEV